EPFSQVLLARTARQRADDRRPPPMHHVPPPRLDAAAARTHVSLFVYFACIVSSAGEFIRSFDINLMSGAILSMRHEFHMGPFEEGFAMGSAIVGCLIGSLIAGPVSSRYGRKRALVICAVLYAISTWGTVFPSTLWQFNLARIIGGIGI